MTGKRRSIYDVINFMINQMVILLSQIVNLNLTPYLQMCGYLNILYFPVLAIESHGPYSS